MPSIIGSRSSAFRKRHRKNQCAALRQWIIAPSPCGAGRSAEHVPIACARCITPYWCINTGNLSFYYRDPDANQVELQIDVFDSPAAVDEWFSGSDFGINPIGVKFDADELIRRFDAGEPEAMLTARPRISPEEIFAQLPNK
jgi:hypothetical protein